MKYAILIYSNPQPWGHPTADYLEVYQTFPAERRALMDQEFDELLAELQSKGELISAEALGDPAASTLYRWGEEGEKLATKGPYAERPEHLAGYFLIKVSSQQRAEQIAAGFSGPGETIELRPVFGS
ncbi:YciI family protein [Psychromicrobium sp. YIM B11713]|uniref:YciI family protein n=1 Tax=Psychromicrobium sp. YIM B11713 TaxID=3145233 RepID=UPI00374EF3D9